MQMSSHAIAVFNTIELMLLMTYIVESDLSTEQCKQL